MQRKILYKLVLITTMTLLLLIPLTMIEEVINDRQRYQHQAVNSISKSWTGSQSIIGPILVIPYERPVSKHKWNSANPNQLLTQHKLLIAPESLRINGEVKTEERQRGIYKIPVYTGVLNIEGKFTNHELLELVKSSPDQPKPIFKKPYLSILISDLRGVVHQPILSWNDKELKFYPGTELSEQTNGMHALPEDVIENGINLGLKDFHFNLKLKLRGMEKINFSPIGAETHVTIQSPWQHPSFTGHYLPIGHTIDEEGFTANWQTSSFSSNSASQLQQCAAGNCNNLLNDHFGVSFIQPVDSYLQSERSVKYGILFLTLTFVVFFLYEVMRKLAVHPVQYLLVGLALSLFFLLLVSFSEIMHFALAYALSAMACTLLLGSYVSGVLDNVKTGTFFSVMLAILYVVLYIIISSEDNALMMGSLLLFMVLAAVMIMTRRINWYDLGLPISENQDPKEAKEKTYDIFRPNA